MSLREIAANGMPSTRNEAIHQFCRQRHEEDGAADYLLVGGFLAAGLTVVEARGPLLNPAPQWRVIAIVVAAGVAGTVCA